MSPSSAPADNQTAGEETGRLRLPAARLAILVLMVIGLLVALFGIWEVLERRYLWDRLDEEALHLLHILRGIASSLILAVLVVVYLLRQPASFPAAPRPEPDDSVLLDREEAQRRHAQWFVNLRWIATAFSLGLILISVPVARILPGQALIPLLAWWSLLPVANLAFARWSKRGGQIERQIVAQALFDLVVLTGLLNASGGIENPLFFVYLFHVILACILLPRRKAFVVTAAAAALVSLIAVGEYLGVLPHYTNQLFPHEESQSAADGGLEGEAGHSHDAVGHASQNLVFVLGRWLPFLAVMLLTAYLTSLLAERLRDSERQLERSTRRLMLEHQRLERVVDGAGIGMMSVAPELEIVWSSRRASDWLELPADKPTTVCPLYQAPNGCKECIAEATLRSGVSRESEREVVTATGERRYFRHVTSPVLDPQGDTIQAVELLEDVTARKALEAEALHHGKLSVLGQMAAGIAHEIGNPLSSLSTRLQLMERRPDPEFLQQSIGVLRGQIDRIGRIVQCVSAFGRPRGREWTSWPVNEVLEEAVDLVAMDRRAKAIVFNRQLSEPSPRGPRPDLPGVLEPAPQRGRGDARRRRDTGASARISSTASGSSRSQCHRFGTGGKTSPSSWSTSCTGSTTV